MREKVPTGQRMTENEIGTRVIEAAIAVHRELGSGLLETVYEVVLARELTERGLMVVRQVQVPIACKGIVLDEEIMRTGITRCVNGPEEQPLRPRACAGDETEVPTTGGYVARIPSP
jgi:hypothetical protein